MSSFATAAVSFFQNLEKQRTFIRLQGRNEGEQGEHNSPDAESQQGAPNHYGECRVTAGAPKSPNNITSAFFNAVHLLLKDLKLEHDVAKLASCPWRCFTSLHPCTVVCHTPAMRCEYPHHTGEPCFACGYRKSTVMSALNSKYMVGKAALYFENHFKNWSKFIRVFSFKTHQEAVMRLCFSQ